MAELLGKTCTLSLGNSDLGEIISFSGPSMTVSTVNVSVLADKVARFREGRSDMGEVSGTLQFDPGSSNCQSLLALVLNPEVKTWTITYSDDDESPTEWDFEGILTSFGVKGFEDESQVTGDFSIKVSEAITDMVEAEGS
jgi:hypothetical protein